MAPLKRKADAVNIDIEARNKQYQINRNEARRRKRQKECVFKAWVPPPQVPCAHTTLPRLSSQLAATPAQIPVYNETALPKLHDLYISQRPSQEEQEADFNITIVDSYEVFDTVEDVSSPPIEYAKESSATLSAHNALPLLPQNERQDTARVSLAGGQQQLVEPRASSLPEPLLQQPEEQASVVLETAIPLAASPVQQRQQEQEDKSKQLIELLNAQEKAILVLNSMFSTLSCNSCK